MSDPPAYRHPPYQGGQGGSNLKSIFNLIITSYLMSLAQNQTIYNSRARYLWVKKKKYLNNGEN
ncbi:MAG: hypothetical protein DWQ51_07375 [Microcystis wesenbergii TW10]|uniref:Uncharacterized protein n=1 Tax=Microcystis wesenbergii TW10 TaxID=2060474 RepID=A0A3E0M3K6_9CHRO|nr:MAG: hypothetical protein DWQ51_07375 [Microcystis wesenbergii TW10]